MAIVQAMALVLVNIILFFLFGCAIHIRGISRCPWSRRPSEVADRGMSLSRTVFTGFFFYYLLFSVCCIAVTLKWRPLHVLTKLWIAVVIAVSLIGVIRGYALCKPAARKAASFINSHRPAFIIMTLVFITFAAIVLISYQFTLDASFYVGNVTTSLQTDTLNIYDPFTGDWQDHFEMRYFFATFPMNDAVMCSLFRIHLLLWCKITMSATAMLLTFMVMYMMGRRIFGDDAGKICLFLVFSSVANFFMITIYTTSTFLTTRNYEGKCLLANVVLPGILFVYTELLDDVKDIRAWLTLLLIALGAPVLSSSSNMLVPAMIGVTMIPLAFMRKDIWVIPKSILCMIPGVALTGIYILYVRNIVVFYTYQR
jgi:hypothetical protein